MLWLVDDEEQLNLLKKQQIKEAFVEIIPIHPKIHPVLNNTSLIFIRALSKKEGFLMCISHSESRSLFITSVCALLRSIDKIWVRNKKQFLHYFDLPNVNDLSFIDDTYVENLPIYNFYYQKYRNIKNINRIIPISKHYENCQNIFEKIKELPKIFSENLYNSLGSQVFGQVEKNGLKINKEIFDKFFNVDQEYYSIQDDKIYTQYNLYTTTRRPSNAFNGVNFAALNKDNGCRKTFIPQNDYFVEFDLSAYHPTLISNLINYDFCGDGVYEHFSKLFNKDIKITKKLLLSQLYGGTQEKYQHLEFFKKVQMFVDDKWSEFKNEGILKCSSGFIISGNKLENMSPNKLFNYILQELETSTNILIIKDILDILKNKQSKLVLYTYDSFTLDIWDQEKELIKDIENIFKKKNLKFKIKQELSL